MYLDESGIENTLYREYARAPRGEQVISNVSGKKAQRIRVIAAYKKNKIKAPFRFEGYTDTCVFNSWVEKCLIAEHHPGDVVILDNASFHKSAKTKELIERAGCRVLFLPPYSPDLNPIEHIWAAIKTRIRELIPKCDSFSDAIDQAILMY